MNNSAKTVLAAQRIRSQYQKPPPPRTVAETAADYIVPGICLILIVALMESLNLFLLEVAASGPGVGRFRWVLFWFVLGTVLISRIAVEVSPGAAVLYTVALVGAMSLFAHWTWLVWLVLLASWWISNKLVRACSNIEQAAPEDGLLDRAFQWARAWMSRRKMPAPPSPAKRLSPAGLLGICAAAALLIFGVGELQLPAEAGAYPFALALVFSFSALGLLLAFSFLQVRQYLRQFELDLSAGLARAWFTRGLLLMASVFCVAVLLPRPAAQHTWQSLFRAAPDARTVFTKPDASAPSRPKSREVQPQNARPQPIDRLVSSSKTGTAVHRASAVDLSRMLIWLGYLACFVVLAFFIWRNRSALRLLIRSGLDRFARWRNRGRPLAASSSVPAKPLAAGPEQFENPFRSGAADSMSASDLICYTFCALESAAARYGWRRFPEETPYEFHRRLLGRAPDLADAARSLVDLRVRCAYSHDPGLNENRSQIVDILRRFWLRLDDTVQAPVRRLGGDKLSLYVSHEGRED